METFLRGSYHDLLRRCEVLRSMLKSKGYHPDVADYAGQILDLISKTEIEVTHLLADPSLGSEKMLANNLGAYRLRAQFIKLLEWYPVAAILSYGESDHYFFGLVSRIANQINYPFPIPIVSALSKGYYWSQPLFNLIGVPALEEHSLLGLPDLLHEMGHLIIGLRKAVLLGGFGKELKAHFAREKQSVRDGQKPPEYEEMIEDAEQQWSDEWTAEFASDMIATYLVGPAYAWANLRLCSSSLSDNVFEPGPDDLHGTHPSDDARMTGIVQMLAQSKMQATAASLGEKWEEYVRLTGHVRPPDYAFCYPVSLLEKLADCVFRGCTQLKLKPFSKQEASTEGDINIPILINGAWDEFSSNPLEYPKWEEARLDELASSRQGQGA